MVKQFNLESFLKNYSLTKLNETPIADAENNDNASKDSKVIIDEKLNNSLMEEFESLCDLVKNALSTEWEMYIQKHICMFS